MDKEYWYKIELDMCDEDDALYIKCNKNFSEMLKCIYLLEYISFQLLEEIAWVKKIKYHDGFFNKEIRDLLSNKNANEIYTKLQLLPQRRKPKHRCRTINVEVLMSYCDYSRYFTEDKFFENFFDEYEKTEDYKKLRNLIDKFNKIESINLI